MEHKLIALSGMFESIWQRLWRNTIQFVNYGLKNHIFPHYSLKTNTEYELYALELNVFFFTVCVNNEMSFSWNSTPVCKIIVGVEAIVHGQNTQRSHLVIYQEITRR